MTRASVRSVLLGFVLPLAALLSGCQIASLARPPGPAPSGLPQPPTGVPPSPPPSADSPPVGGLDSWQAAPTAVVNGWAFDADSARKPVMVLVSLGANFAPIQAYADQPSQARAGLVGPNHGFAVDVSKHLALIPKEKRNEVPLKIFAVNARRDGSFDLNDRVTIHDKAVDLSGAGNGAAEARRVKVEYFLFDPDLPSKGGKRASEVYGWTPGKQFVLDLEKGLTEATGGAVRFELVRGEPMGEWPKLIDPVNPDGERQEFSEKDFVLAVEEKVQPVDVREFDAYEFLKRKGVFERLGKKEVDEVWFVGIKFPSTPLTRMGGRGADQIDKRPVGDVVDRVFFMHTFDLRGGLDEARSTLGQRVTMCLDHTFQGQGDTPWVEFTNTDADKPGKAGAGRFNQPPNAKQQNDFTNANFVASICDSFRLEYPAMSRRQRQINAKEWGGTPAGFHHWWMRQIPHHPGRSAGKSNDWWTYFVDPLAP